MPITSGYTDSEAFYNPILWYDRPQAGMKRSAHQAALDAYNMMDSCGYYHQLQAPAIKYMKPEPVTYYQYADDAEHRYHSNISATAHSQIHSTFTSGSSLTNYTPSHYASCYSTTTASAAAAAAAAAYQSLTADSTHSFSLGHHSVTPSQTANEHPQTAAVSPAQPSRVEEAASIAAAPLTPPLSVSPVGGESPTPHSIASNPSLPHSSGYQQHEKESASTYHHRSATSSPCTQADCDSTTTSNDHFLSEGEIIPKLPLHVLSDLSEGLPLPGRFTKTPVPQYLLCNLNFVISGSAESEANYIPTTSAPLTAQGKSVCYVVMVITCPLFTITAIVQQKLQHFLLFAASSWKHLLNSY